MPLSYTPNTPQASSTVASTQNPILVNFQSIDTALNGPTGGGSGGGNFTTYTLQNTTASFAAKPVNPIGALHTVVTSGGNPELAWINNVNSVGAGPFTGTRVTGGGVTSAAWCQFNGTLAGTNAPNEAYNVATVTRNSVGNYTVNFTRSFATTNYSVQIMPSINANGTSIQMGTRNTGNVTFLVRNNLALVDPNDCSVVIFGTLV